MPLRQGKDNVVVVDFVEAQGEWTRGQGTVDGLVWKFVAYPLRHVNGSFKSSSVKCNGQRVYCWRFAVAAPDLDMEQVLFSHPYRRQHECFYRHHRTFGKGTHLVFSAVRRWIWRNLRDYGEYLYAQKAAESHYKGSP